VTSEGDARARITQRFPDVRARTIRRMPHVGWGGDSDAFLVDDRWIFRFPRYDETRAQLAMEERLLPRLAPVLPLAIPRFTHVARGPAGRPEFAGYEVIHGEPGGRPPAAEIAAFIAALHAFPVDDAAACGVAPALREPVREEILALLAAGERRWVAALEARLRSLDHEPHLAHGDLSTDHILCDGGRPTGVIDWSDASIFDPASDLVWCCDFGIDYLDTVLEHYGADDPGLRERVLVCAALVPLVQVGWGLSTGSDRDVREGIDDFRDGMHRLAGALGGLAI
jgi:aminoglycoside phosphotransferase (APT) family kinase protein